jgi:putative membrane protein
MPLLPIDASATLSSHPAFVPLLIVAAVFIALAALFHVYVFVLESVLWARPTTWRVFGIRSQDEANTIRPMALNQGFYNLFLAIGAVLGLLTLPSNLGAGSALVFLSTGSMLAAAPVLLISSKGANARAAILQGTLPLIAIVLLAAALLAH